MSIDECNFMLNCVRVLIKFLIFIYDYCIYCYDSFFVVWYMINKILSIVF